MWYCSPTSSLVAIISRSRRMTIPNAVVTPTENRLEVPQEGKRNVSLFGSSDGWNGRGVMVTRSSEIKVMERVKGAKGGEGERIHPKGVWEEYEEIGQKG